MVLHLRAVAFCLLSVSIIANAAPQHPATPAPNPMQPLIERYTTDRRLLHTVYSDPLSPTTRDRLAKFNTEWKSRLTEVNFASLDQEGKVDYLLLKNFLTRQDHQQAVAAEQWKKSEPFLPFAADIFAIEDARRAIERPDGEKTAARLTAMLTSLTRRRKELEKELSNPSTHPNRIDAWHAAENLDHLRNNLHRWYEFYNGYDPLFTWWNQLPYKKLDDAMKDYSTFLREKVAGVAADDKTTVIGTPVGRQALLDQLSDEMIPYTPEELITMARSELAWCKEQMLKASREMGYGDDWHKALEAVKTKYVEPGKQPELILQLEKEAEQFIDKNQLVTVPDLAREGWRMEMMSPERQLVNPFFTGGDTISVSYPTDTMTYSEREMSMRGNNIYFSRATVFHEEIPGHWLQEYSMARNHPYRELFATGFWIEGNSLYWEMNFWDHGFDQTPEQRIGALFWRMHRCARIIFSLSFHLGQMTPDQAIDFLVNEIGHERDNATAEVRRSVNGSYDPLYQCAYLVGGMQFRALNHELVGSGKMTERQFNDAVFAESSMPLEMLRAILTHQPLTPDYKTSWRFLEAEPQH